MYQKLGEKQHKTAAHESRKTVLTKKGQKEIERSAFLANLPIATTFSLCILVHKLYHQHIKLILLKLTRLLREFGRARNY